MIIKGLDGWHTSCRIVDHGIDPRIIIEARNGSLGVQLGYFNCRQAMELANMIISAVGQAQICRLSERSVGEIDPRHNSNINHESTDDEISNRRAFEPEV